MATKSTNVQGFAPTGGGMPACCGCYLCEVEREEREAEAAAREAVAEARRRAARERVLAALDAMQAGI